MAWACPHPRLAPALCRKWARAQGQVAVLRDGFYGEAFAQLQLQPAFRDKLLYTNNVPQKLSLLEHKRIIGLIEERSQFKQWAKHHAAMAGNFTEHLVINRNPVYFAVSRKGLSPQQRDLLRQSWARVYGSAAHKAILARYGWPLQ